MTPRHKRAISEGMKKSWRKRKRLAKTRRKGRS